jgi:uracil-DNA glycosylase family 4
VSSTCPPHGPLDAPIVWIGEAPGKTEMERGMPFCGSSGVEVRKTLRLYDLDPENVRYTNCIRTNPGDFPTGKRGAQLLKEWAPLLDEEMREIVPRVMVLCGGQALRRMTGLTNISDWQCSVLRPRDVAREVEWYKGITHVVVFPPTVMHIIPVLHPAGIMQTKSRKDTAWLRRGVEKVARAVRGELRKVEWRGVYHPSPAQLEDALQWPSSTTST